MRFYKLDVEYPTPDGRPFKDQPDAHYIAAINRQLDPGGDYDVPEWLKDVDILEWVRFEGFPQDRPGHYRYDSDTNTTFQVPLHPKKHFVRRSAAEWHMKTLHEWGCKTNLSQSQPIKWTEVTPGE